MRWASPAELFSPCVRICVNPSKDYSFPISAHFKERHQRRRHCHSFHVMSPLPLWNCFSMGSLWRERAWWMFLKSPSCHLKLGSDGVSSWLRDQTWHDDLKTAQRKYHNATAKWPIGGVGSVTKDSLQMEGFTQSCQLPLFEPSASLRKTAHFNLPRAFYIPPSFTRFLPFLFFLDVFVFHFRRWLIPIRDKSAVTPLCHVFRNLNTATKRVRLDNWTCGLISRFISTSGTFQRKAGHLDWNCCPSYFTSRLSSSQLACQLHCGFASRFCYFSYESCGVFSRLFAFLFSPFVVNISQIT